MLAKHFIILFSLFLALAVATELKGEKPAVDPATLPTAAAVPEPADKHPKEPKEPKEHPPKEPKEHPPKEPKEKKEKEHKKHKDPKDKHPKENEPAAAAAAYAEPQKEAEEAAEKDEPEAAKPAPSPLKRNHNFPMNGTEATVEDEAQQAACGTCCGVDMGDMASKLPFINRK